MALGATTRDVLGLVVAQGMSLVLVGVAAGVAGAFAATRLMESMLFGVSSSDLVTFVGVVLFGTLYAVAAFRALPQLLFLGGLVVLFALMTALWIRTEARHRELTAARRAGRIVLALAIVVIAAPVVVLAPLFWLAEQLPPEVGLHGARGGVMALVLIALMLVFLVNVAGTLVAAGRGALGRRGAPGGP